MSEILKRLQKVMKEKEEKKPPKQIVPKKEPPKEEPPKKELPHAIKPTVKKVKRKLVKVPKPEVKPVTKKKRNVQYNKSQLLKLLNTVNLTDLSPKQKRALKTLGTSEPMDKSDRKNVTLYDQKKTTLASLELILSIFMQQPIKITLVD